MNGANISEDIAPIQIFITEWTVRITWIAFTTLWVFWGFSWFIRFAFRDNSQATPSLYIQSSQYSNTARVNPEVPSFHVPSWSVNIFNRLNRAHDMIRDIVLLLLSVLTLNTFARASTRAVMIIAWIIVALTAVYFALQVSFTHHYLRLTFALIFYGLGLAIVGLAFKQGFY